MSDDRLIDMALAFIVYMLGSEAFGALRSPRTRVVLRGLRPSHFLRAVPVFVLVAVVAVTAIAFVPYADIGWWSALGGQGNALLGSVGPRPDPSWIQRAAPWTCLLLIVMAAPSLVRWEERHFRRAADRQSTTRGALRQAWFGAAHLLVGVPIGAAIALMVAGLLFQRAYLRGLHVRHSRLDALMASTRLHLAYNYVALMLVGALLTIQSL